MNDVVLANQIIDKLKENIEREGDYVYNNNTGKLHKSTCGRVKLMNNEIILLLRRKGKENPFMKFRVTGKFEKLL